MRTKLEQMLAQGRDNALLRFGLGNACLQEGDAVSAAEHLRSATQQDPNYSAAWKLLGKALLQAGQLDEAEAALGQGIAVAEKRGDTQAAKEMQVFLKRVAKQRAEGSGA